MDVTPVWMMRQAGRYLPEYRATRAKAGDFLSLCPDLACEVTLQPLDRYELDAAILFLRHSDDSGCDGTRVVLRDRGGPRFRKTVRSQADVDQLIRPNIQTDLDYVVKAVSTIRGALNGRVPLIGFSGSPWTLATYMIEGGSSKDFRESKKLMYCQPEVLHSLLSVLADTVVDYLNAQIEAGAQAVQIFDTWVEP